jgi:predicted DNA-binding protein
MATMMVKSKDKTEAQAETSETKATKQNANTKMLRVSVDISPQFNERLSYLSGKLGISKAEVLKKAFVLLDAVVESTEDRSKKFGIANKDQTLETEFIGLW